MAEAQPRARAPVADLARALRDLKRRFEAEVKPSLRRHAAYTGPGERRRLKSRKARKRAAARFARGNPA
jgi:ribosomal protein S21